MSMLDCLEPYWACCDSSISPNKFYAFSSETEEHFEKIEQEIADIEASGLTYEGGDYIDITNKTISVTGITPNDFASKDDLEELSGKVETLSGKVDTLSATVETISGDVITISGNTDNKQDKLAAGSFINIDNSNTISAKIVVLTKAEYNALVTKNPTVLYLIRQD